MFFWLFGFQRIKTVMPRPCFTVLAHLKLFALAVICIWSSAHADEYSDVNQLRKTNPQAALGKAEAFLAGKPADPQMRFLKGLIQSESGKISDAILTFTKLTEDYPELPEPYNNLAVVYAELNRFDKAQAMLERAIRTHPSYAMAHENLGDLHARMADQAYRAALQLDGASAGIRPKLALVGEIFSPLQSNKPAGTVSAGTTLAKPPIVPPASRPPSKPVAEASSTLAAAPVAPPLALAAVPAMAPEKSATANKPAIADKPPEVDINDVKNVEVAVGAWAKAWASRDVTGYLDAYDKKFNPPGKKSRDAWEQERRERITGKASISVQIDALVIKVTGNNATAQFRQAYKAGALAVTSLKTLELVKVGNRWLIVKETASS